MKRIGEKWTIQPSLWLDHAEQEEKKQQAEQKKAANKRDRDSGNSNSNSKHGRTNDNGEKKFCKVYKKAGSKFYNNHNTKDCTMKDKYKNAQKMELNNMEELLACQKETTSLLKKFLKKATKEMVTNLIDYTIQSRNP